MQDNEHTLLRSYWDARVDREKEREKTNPAKQIHTALLWREINKCIGGRSGLSILDGGGGCGRFSIPLAEAGHKVVHLDLSSNMLDAAKEISNSRGLAGIEFILGSVDNLAKFHNDQFDLVLCLDSPLSFCVHTYPKALSELIRVSREKIVLCVMNRLGLITEGINFDLHHYGRPRTVCDVLNTGTLLVTDELKVFQPDIMPSWHAFAPDEICGLLERNGCELEHISAPGSLVRFARIEYLEKLLGDKEAYERYLDFEQQFDADKYMLGLGGISGGLLVTARKRK